MNIWAIILAAGQSNRLSRHGITVPKQFLSLDGEPLFWRSAITFSRLAPVRGIIFVLPPHTSPSSYEDFLRGLDKGGRLGLPWRIAAGGERRQDSVRHGLAALPSACDAVLIHDSARPFASPALMMRVIDAIEQGHSAVIPGIAVTDTIKAVDASGRVQCTHDRETLRAVQTPQGFTLGALHTAHARAAEQGWDVTDDASLMERCNLPVLVVEGEESNRKITTPHDLALLESSKENSMSALIPCTGLGYDVHRYGGNRPFILGGVPIRTDVQVAAHSDGDTLLHALMDAMLGCIGGGDIGGMFPDADPAYDNISSGLLLAEVRERTLREGLTIVHADITIIAQTPRIAPHREAIAKNIAKLLHLSPNAVNVKATTEEHLGFTGEKKGIKVMAVVTGLRPAASGAPAFCAAPGVPAGSDTSAASGVSAFLADSGVPADSVISTGCRAAAVNEGEATTASEGDA